MRRYQKWMSVGLLALAPGLGLAGKFDSPANGAGPVAGRSAKKSKADLNQEIAQRVANALQRAKLNGYDIQIDVRDGIVALDGTVGSREQKIAAGKTSSSVPGVTGVNNRLKVGQPTSQRGPIQQTSGTMSQKSAKSSKVRQANYQAANDNRGAIQQASGMQGMPAAMLAQTPTAPVAMPAYGPPDSMGGHAVYNQPNLPEMAWPTYAQYPNYAAVTYPSQYSASAWPYIGPFYPYPQVPLNWRKATLEWNEGNWNLSFDTRTNRWWWPLNPKNW
ncbi:MAG: BON domain-containing protein [Planctomycetia bacterium]|nr:BON domain-containing protein [Planctomycetia bacterium]